MQEVNCEKQQRILAYSNKERSENVVKELKVGRKTRRSFAKVDEILQMPNLIEVQKKSYQWFIDEGLKEVFRDVGVITDYTGNLELSFLD